MYHLLNIKVKTSKLPIRCVIPAKAGIHTTAMLFWIPVFAGMTCHVLLKRKSIIKNLRCFVENTRPVIVIASGAKQSKNTTVAFSAYHERDCHGPLGLAMAFCKGFLQSKFITFHPAPIELQQKPEFNWRGTR